MENVQTPQELSDAQQIGALKELQMSIGWNMLLEVLEDNKAFLEKAILDRKDPQTGDKLSNKEIDDARHKRLLTIELIKTPQKLIRLIERSKAIEIKNFDPYESQED